MPVSASGTQNCANALGRLEPFARMTAAERLALASGARMSRHRRGAVVVERHQDAHAVYAVVSGKLKVVSPRKDGRNATLVILGPGEMFGELAVLSPGRRSARVVAVEESLLVVISGAALLLAVERSPPLALGMLQMLAGRLRQMAAHFDDVTTLDVAPRLARKLLWLAQRFGQPGAGGVGVAVRLSQTDLAELAETSRQSVNRCLQAWKACGWLQVNGGRLVVRDLEALHALASANAAQ